jgi:predicted nucleotidyltransferase component of viral defense system
MTEAPKNTVASIQARLRNTAERIGKPFGEVLQYYGIERFLYRLSKSKYVNQFILKGGLVFYVWNITLRRPTRDIDFRGYLDSSSENILKVISEVVAEPVPDDGITFDSTTISVEQTQIDANYEGVRVRFTGYLGRARIPMQIDIGFSDEIASYVAHMDYPTLLGDTEVVHLKGYPRESMVSEKFHAMVHRADLNSRWKDYYDLWLLSKHFAFDSQSLQKAISKTFTNRRTEIPNARPVALSLEFAHTNRERWRSFLMKSNLHNQEIDGFPSVVERIWAFLELPLLTTISEQTNDHHWEPGKGWK